MVRIVISPLDDADVPASKRFPSGAVLDWEGPPVPLGIA